MKKTDLLSVLTAGASVLVCLYYALYLIFCLGGFDSRLMSFFALFVMACAGLPVLFRDKLKAKLGRAFRPLQWIFTVLLIVYLISVAVFWCYIGFDAAKTPAGYLAAGDSGEDTLILVFGCRTYGYTPSLTLGLRLDAALELLSGMPDALCLVSGGQGSNETVPEAVAMRQYLIDHGIDESRILVEKESHSTSENVRFCKEFIASAGLSDKRIIGVSTSFHLPRIEMLSARYGLPMQLCSAPSPSFPHHYVSMVREYLSYIKMALFDKAVIITKVT